LTGCQERGGQTKVGMQGGRCEFDCGFRREAGSSDEGVSCDGTRGKMDGVGTEVCDILSVNTNLTRTNEVVEVGPAVGVDAGVCAVPEGRLVGLEDAERGLLAKEALADGLDMHVGPKLASDLEAERG